MAGSSATVTRRTLPRAGLVERGLGRSALAAGLAAFVLLGAMVAVLLRYGLPAVLGDHVDFLSSRAWSPARDAFGLLAVGYGTLVASLLAVLLAAPVAVGTALFLAEYAPPRLAVPMRNLVDLLAAIPPVVYGLWGVAFLVPNLGGTQRFLHHWLGWLPLFAGRDTTVDRATRSLFAAGLVLAIMIVPIVAANAREVFCRVEPAHKEAASALGATRWEMVRTAVLPPSRAGIAGALLLGLSRAVGQAVAVALVVAGTQTLDIHLLSGTGNTLAAAIVEHVRTGATGRGTLFAAGLVLLGVTLALDLLARGLLGRHRWLPPARRVRPR